MGNRLLFLFGILTIHTCIFSQAFNKLLPNTFFDKKETLTFDLRYGFITAGQAQLELDEADTNKNNLYHLKGTGNTIGIADKIWRVKDIYESYFDKETVMPVFAIQNVREGRKYKYYNEVRFNRKNNTVVSLKSGEHKVKENTFDILSAFYVVRRIDFSNAKEGDSYKFNTFFSDEEFPFELRYRGKETINTKWGKIKCLKFAPIVEPGRVFKSKDDMLIWYTDDANRIPIKVTMEMIIGHATVELIKFSNLKNNITFSK